jgi:hypothetical protein
MKPMPPVELFLLTTVLSAATTAAEPPKPCISATAACTEHLPLGPEGRFSIVYSSFPLTKPNPRIQRALIVVHGAGRNADSYFASGVAGALLAGALEDTVVVAPRIASNKGGCTDSLAPGEISWICGGDNDWRRGGAADGLPTVHTYDLADQIIRRLANGGTFPNLRTIVVTGHSAGGQFTNRYAAATHIDKEVKLPIRYVVSNPSSYLYLDAARPVGGGSCSDKGGCTNEFREYGDRQNCTTYNRWHYGLENRTGYAAPVPDEQLRKQLILRDVTYLLGELDIHPIYGFDSSCPAMAQGATRLARGINYWNYLKSKYSAEHKLVVVPACGHNGRCMYTSDAAFPVIFPK